MKPPQKTVRIFLLGCGKHVRNSLALHKVTLGYRQRHCIMISKPNCTYTYLQPAIPDELFWSERDRRRSHSPVPAPGQNSQTFSGETDAGHQHEYPSVCIGPTYEHFVIEHQHYYSRNVSNRCQLGWSWRPDQSCHFREILSWSLAMLTCEFSILRLVQRVLSYSLHCLACHVCNYVWLWCMLLMKFLYKGINE